uniref:Protein-tyrosine-phosphatase IBR5 n=1 Tax=Rhizophora mucronata TaxID=61149 RepID=A0A2P2L023_RHIMU
MEILNDATERGKTFDEPDPDEHSNNQNISEPDPDDSQANQHRDMEILNDATERGKTFDEPDPDEHSNNQNISEPDPDDSQANQHREIETLIDVTEPGKTFEEPDPDDLEMKQKNLGEQAHICKAYEEPDPDEFEANRVVRPRQNPVGILVPSQQVSDMQLDEPDPDDEGLQRIQDSATIACGRLQKAIKALRAEVNAREATEALQILLKIIRNVIEHPGEIKFMRLRKANPKIQMNVANYKAAMEILHMVGFHEDDIFDEIGRAETYLMLRRNDPGLLWLAKSSLEACMA